MITHRTSSNKWYSTIIVLSYIPVSLISSRPGRAHLRGMRSKKTEIWRRRKVAIREKWRASRRPGKQACEKALQRSLDRAGNASTWTSRLRRRKPALYYCWTIKQVRVSEPTRIRHSEPSSPNAPMAPNAPNALLAPPACPERLGSLRSLPAGARRRRLGRRRRRNLSSRSARSASTACSACSARSARSAGSAPLVPLAPLRSLRLRGARSVDFRSASRGGGSAPSPPLPRRRRRRRRSKRRARC